MLPGLVERLCPWWQVRARSEAWSHAPADVRSVVASGARLEWGPDGPPPPFTLAERPVSARNLPAVHAELDRLVAIGLLREVPRGSARCRCPAWLLIKQRADGTWKLRIITDLRRVNEYLARRRFRQEGLREVRSLVQPGCVFGVADVRDAFVHVAIHPDDQQFLGFALAGREFVCTAAPFGLAHSPILWKKMMDVVLEDLRAQGVTCVCFVDDVLLIASSQEEYARSRSLLLSAFAKYGVQMAPDKMPAAVGVSTIKYLGLLVSSEPPAPSFSVPPDTLATINQRASQTLRGWEAGGCFRAREIKSVVGKLQSVDLAVSATRLRTRELHNCLGGRFGNARVSLSPQAAADLEWWAKLTPQGGTRRMVPAPLTAPIRIWTDASKMGYGAVLEGQQFGADFPVEWRARSINQLELEAVLLSLRSLRDRLAGRQILLYADNMTVVGALRSATSRVRPIMDLVRSILLLVEQMGSSLHVLHVRSADNPADGPSRDRGYSALDWRLDPTAFAGLERRWRVSHTLDAFASQHAHLVDRYASRLPDPGCAFVDAFSRPWAGEAVFCNPPFALVGRVLAHARATMSPGSRLTLIAPQWPRQWWWPLLMGLRPKRCRIPVSAVLPPPTWASRTVEPRRNTSWQLWAFHIRF